MSLHVTLLLHLASGIVLRYNLCRSRGILRKQLRALLVLNALQLAFSPGILASFEGPETSWTLFVGYPVLALVLGIAALVKYGYADNLVALPLPLIRRLLNTTTGTLGVPQLTRRQSGISTSSARRRRSAHKKSSAIPVMRILLLSVFYLGRIALPILQGVVASTCVVVKWLAPLTSRLFVTVVTVLKRILISSTHAASLLVRLIYRNAPFSLNLLGNEASMPTPSLERDSPCASLGAVVPRHRFYDRWLLLAISCRLQHGAWVAVERIWYRPSTGIMAETWLILVNYMGFEYDLNGTYSIWCGSDLFPGIWFVTPMADCYSFPVNEDALPAAWLQRFGGLWTSTWLDFVAALDVLKSTDPRLALVSLGRSPATARLLARLKQCYQQLVVDVAASSLPSVKLPARGPLRAPISPATTTQMEHFTYDVELDLATVRLHSDFPVNGASDVPSGNISVKLPSASVHDEPTRLQQHDEYHVTAVSPSAPNAETQIVLWVANVNLDTVYETSTEFFDPCEDTDILEAELIEQSVVVHTESWLINGVYVEHNVVVPAEEWEIGDPMIDGTRIETYSVPLYVVDFEADWQGVFWAVLGNPGFPDEHIINPSPFEVSSAIVNDEVLFENWILRFSGLWSSYFLNTLNVIDSSHPRFALVSPGRRAVTPRFIACLLRFITQQLEQAKAVRERDIDSTVPIIKLPSRGKSMPALPPAVFAYADDIAREDGLVTTSVDSDILIMDAPVVSVTVKLPRVNALAAPTQRYDSEGLQGEESREKLRSRATVVSVTVNGKENAPISEDANIKRPRSSTRIAEGGMRLFQNTLRNALFHNCRR